MRQVTSWGGGCTGACVEAEGEMRQLLSPSLPEAGLPPPLLGWAAAPSLLRSCRAPASGWQPRGTATSECLCSSVASECLRTGGRACLRDWENLCAAHAGLGLPRSGPTVLFAPQPRCVPQPGALSQTQPQGPAVSVPPLGLRWHRRCQRNRRAADQDSNSRDAREMSARPFLGALRNL